MNTNRHRGIRPGRPSALSLPVLKEKSAWEGRIGGQLSKIIFSEIARSNLLKCPFSTQPLQPGSARQKKSVLTAKRKKKGQVTFAAAFDVKGIETGWQLDEEPTGPDNEDKSQTQCES